MFRPILPIPRITERPAPLVIPVEAQKSWIACGVCSTSQPKPMQPMKARKLNFEPMCVKHQIVMVSDKTCDNIEML